MAVQTGRRLAPIASVLAVYGLTLAAAIFFSFDILRKAPEIPDVFSSPWLVMLGALPVATLGIALIRARELLAERSKRRFGWKLRTKLAGLFLLMAGLASLPQAAFLVPAARFATTSPASTEITEALEGGVAMAVDSWDRFVAALERAGRTEAPELAARYAPDGAEEALLRLRSSNPDIASLEFFSLTDGGPSHASIAPADAPRWDGPIPNRGLQPKEGSTLRWFARASGGLPFGVMIAARPPEGFDAAAERLTRALSTRRGLSDFATGFLPWMTFFYAMLVAPLLLLSTLFALAAADSFVVPLRAIEDAVQLAGTGDLSARLIAKRDDELGEVARGVNSLIARMESGRAREAWDERVSAWRDIAQRLAHELKNPLTPIKLTAERVLRKARDDREGACAILEDSMVAIIKEVDGMTALLGEFRSFARLPEPSYAWIDARSVAEEAVAIHEAAEGAVFDLSGVPEGITLRADREHVRRALSNVILNAIDAMDGRGRVTIRAELVKRSDSGYCRFSVRDEGRGIPEEIRDRIFTPYFTTKEHGTGLGLAIAERIAVEHGGSIRFQSDTGAGTTFFIDLPAGS